MNDKISRLDDIIASMKLGGFTPNEDVADRFSDLTNPKLNIAFVGKFQVGKSHIINKLFLGGEQLLPEGNGLCMTAVTVSVRYGGNAELSYVDNKGGEIISIQNPNVNDIAPHTASEENEERERIYNTKDNVVLSYPNKQLENVTVYDTPGIDDPNPKLLRQTTYNLLPNADVVVMVVPPQALSRTELRFLQKKIFGSGINRFMILISRKPGCILEDTGMDNLVEEIKGQLAGIGKPEIPVLIYNEEEGSPCEIDGVALNDIILESAKNFAVQNRYCKAKRAVECQLREEIYKLGLLNATYCRTQAERNLIKIEALKKLEEMKQGLEDLRNEFNAKMTLHRNACVMGFQSELAVLRGDFISKLKEADGLGEAQKILENADESLGVQIEDVSFTRMEQLREEAEKTFRGLKVNLRKIWDAAAFDVILEKVDGGRVQKWDATYLTMGDYLLSTFVLPGGLIVSLGLRFLLGRIPVLRDIMPTNILKGHMIEVVNESLEHQMRLICDDFARSLEVGQQKVIAALCMESEKEIAHQKPVLESIEKIDEESDAINNSEKIYSKIKMIGELLDAVSEK